MFLILLILILSYIIFLLNKKCTSLNHLTINLFLENRLISKILEESSCASNSYSLKNHLDTIEDFFDIKIHMWSPNNHYNNASLPLEILDFLKSERLAIINHQYENKLQTKYLMHSNESVSKLHVISHKILHSKSDVALIVHEQSIDSLSSFDIQSSIPILSKILCAIYASEPINKDTKTIVY